MLDLIQTLLAMLPALLLGWAAVRRSEALVIRARKGERPAAADGKDSGR